MLAGGISDGVALRAAVALGTDLAYMGTRFIAASESMAGESYRIVQRRDLPPVHVPPTADPEIVRLPQPAEL